MLRTQHRDPLLTHVFHDDFERAQLGPSWLALAPAWRVVDGQLCGREAKNRGVWLRRRLPTNVRIEVDAVARSEAGDIKLEIFGDGRTGATSASYRNASGYVLIYGGWRNSLHVTARLDEHGIDRAVTEVAPGATARAAPVVAGRRYHITVERRDGRSLAWWVDGEPIHEIEDSEPLVGPGHDHLAFNVWSAPVCFDNLVVTPLQEKPSAAPADPAQ